MKKAVFATCAVLSLGACQQKLADITSDPVKAGVLTKLIKSGWQMEPAK